jgi:hypothetical protein
MVLYFIITSIVLGVSITMAIVKDDARKFVLIQVYGYLGLSTYKFDFEDRCFLITTTSGLYICTQNHETKVSVLISDNGTDVLNPSLQYFLVQGQRPRKQHRQVRERFTVIPSTIEDVTKSINVGNVSLFLFNLV